MPFLIALEHEDRPVWVKQTEVGLVVQLDKPTDEDVADYSVESYAELWRQASYASEWVINALQSMTAPGDLTEHSAEDRALSVILASGWHGFRLFEMDFASQVLPDFDMMYSRALQVTQLVLLTRPGARAAGYLKRIPKAYVFGLDAETIILCRAALEAAVKDCYERRSVAIPPGMRQRLESARVLGWLGDEGQQDGWLVWRRGNEVVHDSPDDAPAALDTIRRTIGVIEELASGD